MALRFYYFRFLGIVESEVGQCCMHRMIHAVLWDDIAGLLRAGGTKVFTCIITSTFPASNTSYIIKRHAILRYKTTLPYIPTPDPQPPPSQPPPTPHFPPPPSLLLLSPPASAAPLPLHALTTNPTTSPTPTPFFTCAKTTGPPSLILPASLSITPKSAPTASAKSVLFTTSKSLPVIPGPPFLGTLSPPATSMT